MHIPVELPAGWSFEVSPAHGVIITGVDDRGSQGFVSISERQRNFELGISVVRRQGAYTGRNWRESLYGDAIEALQDALS